MVLTKVKSLRNLVQAFIVMLQFVLIKMQTWTEAF